MPIKSDFEPVQIDDQSFTNVFLNALWTQFSKNPNRVALINGKNETDRVTFGELYAYSHNVAGFLTEHKFIHGDVSFVVLPNCWHFYTIFGGSILCGGSISGANPVSKEFELHNQILDSKSKVIFCTSENLETIVLAIQRLDFVKAIVVVPQTGLYSKWKSLKLPNNCKIYEFQKVLEYDPFLKDVVIDPEKNILILPYSSHFKKYILPYVDKDYDYEKDYQMFMLPFYHIYGFGMSIQFLMHGSTGIILQGFHEDLFCKVVEKYKLKLLFVVPPILIFMANNEIVRNYDFSSVRLLFSGAAPAGRDLCMQIHKRLPEISYIAQGILILIEKFIGYGMTEVSMGIALPFLDRNDRFEASGKLIANMEMKVAPAELEDLLLSHPHIKDCAVIGIPDPNGLGELPMAFVVKTNNDLTENDVINFVKVQVIYYKQLKGGVQFVSSIPKSPSGKILRRFLRDNFYNKL